jgi:hypothetical protein
MYPAEIFRDTLSRLLDILTRHDVRFHLTGGITSVAYGEPRMTQDIDIVVDNPALARSLEAFTAAATQAGFMLDAEAFDDHAALHHEIDPLGDGDVVEGVARHGDDVGGLADREDADVVPHQQLCRHARSRPTSAAAWMISCRKTVCWRRPPRRRQSGSSLIRSS